MEKIRIFNVFLTPLVFLTLISFTRMTSKTYSICLRLFLILCLFRLCQLKSLRPICGAD